ncbi:hypothetical protein [Maricaulis sp.]|uniref:hypothetical protein n=1 Tax=Maricaulis sp. TaxID=1486257 RepID=UPI002638E881|nr:hypothetical protein [Maricaulis sp.]
MPSHNPSVATKARAWVMAALLTGVSATPLGYAQSDDPRLVGRWYGHDYHADQERYYQRIAERTADGRFTLEFRRYEQCQLIEQQTISGTWWVSGDFWGTEATLIDGYATRLENTYVLTDYDGTHTRYRHPATGNSFTYERVDPEFDFPACNLMM